MLLGFEKAGITNKDEQANILNNKIKDLCIIRDVEDFVYIEKEGDVNIC